MGLNTALGSCRSNVACTDSYRNYKLFLVPYLLFLPSFSSLYCKENIARKRMSCKGMKEMTFSKGTARPYQTRLYLSLLRNASRRWKSSCLSFFMGGTNAKEASSCQGRISFTVWSSVTKERHLEICVLILCPLLKGVLSSTGWLAGVQDWSGPPCRAVS